MTAQARNEGKITAKIKGTLKQRGAYVRKVHQSRFSQGMLDIVAVYRSVPIFLEVKDGSASRGLTPLQAATIEEIRKAGGVAVMVTSPEQVELLLDAIDARARKPFVHSSSQSL